MVGKAKGLASQSVDVGRLCVFYPVTSQFGTKVVHGDKQYISRWIVRTAGVAAKQACECDEIPGKREFRHRIRQEK